MQLCAALSAGILVVLGSSLVWAQNDTIRVMSKALGKCSNDPNFYSCLKAKAVTLLDRALALDSLPITDYVTIVRDSGSSGESAPPETSLPRDLGNIDRILVDRLARYFRTRTVQLSVPKDVFEGRKGNKGGKGGKGGILLVFGAFAAMMVQLALGKLALIAGKALLVGKVALLLAGIVGIKSLISSGQGEAHSPQVVYAEPEHDGSWGRSLRNGADLAYRGQKTSNIKIGQL